MTQANLFDAPLPPIARRRDPVGSKVAAHKVTQSGQRENNCKKVLLLVKDFPGSTSKELGSKTWEIDRHEAARRLSDLEKQGKVRKAGFREGTKECLWEAV